MTTGWSLSTALATDIAAAPGSHLAVPASALVTCVYALRDRHGAWTTQALPLWPAALYVALDEQHRCLYTGVVQRGTTEHPDMNAIRHRTAEHYRDNEPPEARTTWHHLWVIPLHHGLPRADLEEWETRVRRRTASPQTRRSRLLGSAA
ncbi:hypothetical protein HCJ76_43720 [Streptomyces sp. MC1]|uniref:hypothetical protein n=1 Tax=Streptomyces sp. MC1 TaxID=295105 RepID=UPI0018C903F7|nr:hypothetical protein [Streptomyces sp. MC1]MBG7704793.1 hypothetical protein [Streptomyces sp. MC1]